MEKICLSQRRIDEIKNVCRKYGNDPGELINILHGVQDTLGYLPKEVQELIALELGISAARVYGVVSFYSFFTMKPKGKYPISVCMGTACYVRGGEKVLDEFRRQLGIEVGGTPPDGLFSLDSLLTPSSASSLRGRRPATVSRSAHHLSARHTIQASRHVGGTGTSGNICRTIIFRSRGVSSKSSSARARAKNGWRKPCSRWLGSGSCQS